MAVLEELFGEDIRLFILYAGKMWEGWLSKVSLSLAVFFGLDCSGYYGHPFLGTLLIKLMLLDLVVGCWDACKNKSWDTKVFFTHGLTKFPVYGFYCFLVASGDRSLQYALGQNLPIIELFIVYLCVAEVYSIIKHAHYIGFHVPEILLWFSFGFKKKIEKKIKEVLPDGQPPVNKTTEQLIKEQEEEEQNNGKNTTNAL